jgi:uroporphyrinogen decarboxylase
MDRNMYKWLENMKNAKVKKPLPILSFPAVQLAGITVSDLVRSGEKQAECMKLVADRCDAAASVSMMDLSVEAEAFGAAVRFSDDEIPTVTGRLIETAEQAQALEVPEIGAGRTGEYLKGARLASQKIADRPVFGGVIGPFSLAGRLMGMTDIMVQCFTEPETVRVVLEKAAEFIAKYVLAYKEAGASGVVMAEPAAGLLSPKMNDEFSTAYVRGIIEAAQDERFLVIYHNCGNTIPLVKSLLANGAKAYHFGNAIDMLEMLKLMPPDKVVMGNVDPSGRFMGGTPETVYTATTELMERCGGYSNWVPSSGCDIPPRASWENIDAFFRAVKDYYASHNVVELNTDKGNVKLGAG